MVDYLAFVGPIQSYQDVGMLLLIGKWTDNYKDLNKHETKCQLAPSGKTEKES